MRKRLWIALVVMLMVLFQNRPANPQEEQEEDLSYISLYAKPGQNPNWDDDKLFELKQRIKRMDGELQTAIKNLDRVQRAQASLSQKVNDLLRTGGGIESRRAAEIRKSEAYGELAAEIDRLNAELGRLIEHLKESGLLEEPFETPKDPLQMELEEGEEGTEENERMDSTGEVEGPGDLGDNSSDPVRDGSAVPDGVMR